MFRSRRIFDGMVHNLVFEMHWAHQKMAKTDLQNRSKNKKMQKLAKFTMNSSFSTKTWCTWVVLMESSYKPCFPFNNFSQYCEILPRCCKIAYIVKNWTFYNIYNFASYGQYFTVLWQVIERKTWFVLGLHQNYPRASSFGGKRWIHNECG